MLDLKAIRQDPDKFRQGVKRKKYDPALIDQLLEADEAWRSALTEVERLKSVRNKASEAIAMKKKQGQDASAEIAEMKSVSEKIKERDERVRQWDEQVHEMLLGLPNIPHESVPDGDDENDNVT